MSYDFKEAAQQIVNKMQARIQNSGDLNATQQANLSWALQRAYKELNEQKNTTHNKSWGQLGAEWAFQDTEYPLAQRLLASNPNANFSEVAEYLITCFLKDDNSFETWALSVSGLDQWRGYDVTAFKYPPFVTAHDTDKHVMLIATEDNQLVSEESPYGVKLSHIYTDKFLSFVPIRNDRDNDVTFKIGITTSRDSDNLSKAHLFQWNPDENNLNRSNVTTAFFSENTCINTITLDEIDTQYYNVTVPARTSIILMGVGSYSFTDPEGPAWQYSLSRGTLVFGWAGMDKVFGTENVVCDTNILYNMYTKSSSTLGELWSNDPGSPKLNHFVC